MISQGPLHKKIEILALSDSDEKPIDNEKKKAKHSNF